MQIGALNTSNACLRWPSHSARFAFPYITMSGTGSRWAAGNLPLAQDIAATSSYGTVAMESSRFAGHFTLAKAVLPVPPQWLMSRLVFLLHLIRFNISSASSSHAQTPNPMKPTPKPFASRLAHVHRFSLFVVLSRSAARRHPHDRRSDRGVRSGGRRPNLQSMSLCSFKGSNHAMENRPLNSLYIYAKRSTPLT